jgi:hypothetical protein
MPSRQGNYDELLLLFVSTGNAWRCRQALVSVYTNGQFTFCPSQTVKSYIPEYSIFNCDDADVSIEVRRTHTPLRQNTMDDLVLSTHHRSSYSEREIVCACMTRAILIHATKNAAIPCGQYLLLDW